MFLDLDHVISKELAIEIKSNLLNPKKNKAFSILNTFVFMGKEIKFGGWQNNKAIAIFNKNHFQYSEDSNKETFKTNGTIAVLKNKLINNSYTNFDAFNDELTLKSKLEAEKMYLNKIKPNALHLIFKPLFKFISQYFLKFGFLDGKEGFILAYIYSFYVFKRYLQLWMMYRKIN